MSQVSNLTNINYDGYLNPSHVTIVVLVSVTLGIVVGVFAVKCARSIREHRAMVERQVSEHHRDNFDADGYGPRRRIVQAAATTTTRRRRRVPLTEEEKRQQERLKELIMGTLIIRPWSSPEDLVVGKAASSDYAKCLEEGAGPGPEEAMTPPSSATIKAGNDEGDVVPEQAIIQGGDDIQKRTGMSPPTSPTMIRRIKKTISALPFVSDDFGANPAPAASATAATETDVAGAAAAASSTDGTILDIHDMDIVDEEDYDAAECAICLGNYKDGQLVCEATNRACIHVFHSECMLNWLLDAGKVRNECPVCKQAYLLDEHVDSIRNTGTQ